MAVRQRGKGNTWQVDYYPFGRKGQRKRFTFKGTREEAEQLADELSRQNLHVIPKKAFIKQALSDWLIWCQNNLSETTAKDMEKCVRRNIRPFFGAIRFLDLMPTTIEAYKTKRIADGVKGRTINKELSYFSSLIRWAYNNKYCSLLPFKVELIPETDSPDPVLLTFDEVQLMIDNIEPQYRCIFLLGYDMGLRRTEALKLTVERINITGRTVCILGKNKKESTLPIATDRLLDELVNATKAAGSGFLFINPDTDKPYYSIRKAILRAAVKSKINKRVYSHLLRHCFGAHGLEAGMNTRVMQDLLRHSTIKTTERYTKISAQFKKAEVRKFASIVERDKGPMQKIIGGRRYDTSTAELIAEQTNSLPISDADYVREDLYRTAKGNWFILGEGGARSRYAKDGLGVGRDIIPINANEAQGWLERYSTCGAIEQYFGTEIEDA